MRREVNEWAIVQKDIPGMEILHEEYKKRLARYGVTPDLWIFPPKMSIYAAMVPPTVVDRNHELGQSTTKSFAAGPSAMGTFRGVTVYETRTFDVYENELPIDLLRRNQQIGEYYVMADPHRYDNEDEHPASHRDIIIYDEELDNWRRITFRHAATNAVNLGEDGLLEAYVDNEANRRRGRPNALDRAAVADAVERHDMARFAPLPDQRDLRIGHRFGVTHRTRTLASFSQDKHHLKEATRGWNGQVQSRPAFLAQRMADHDRRVRASNRAAATAAAAAEGATATAAAAPNTTHRIVQVATGAPEKNNGFFRDKTTGLTGVYASANGPGGKHTGRAQEHDTEVLFVDERRTQASWKGANLDTEFATARTQATAAAAATAGGGATATAAAAAATAAPQRVRPKSLVEHCADFVAEVDEARAGRSGAQARHAGQDRTVGSAAQWNSVPAAKRSRRTGVDAAEDLLFGSGSLDGATATAAAYADSPEYRYAQQVLGHAQRLGYRYGHYGEETVRGYKAAADAAAGVTVPNIGDPITKEFIEALLDAQVRVPFDVLLLRPFMEYEMSSAVLMKGGYETGATFVGHSDFILGDDARHDSAEDFFRLNSCALYGPGLHAHSRVLLCSFMTGFHSGRRRPSRFCRGLFSFELMCVVRPWVACSFPRIVLHIHDRLSANCTTATSRFIPKRW